jgi:hypothetical protein
MNYALMVAQVSRIRVDLLEEKVELLTDLVKEALRK